MALSTCSSSVKSAERVVAVLEVLGRHLRPVPTMRIAAECGIPKSSTHHLLNVLRERGFVTYYPDDRAWGLGSRVFELGSAYLRRAPLERLAHPILERLAGQTGETAHLAVLHGTDVLYLDKQQGHRPGPRLVTEAGVRLPAHLAAVGRAILAWLDVDQVRALYGRRPLVNRTGQGPFALEDLLRELRNIRANGYAVEAGLITPGITCVAAPVFSHEDVCIAAVGITFTTVAHRGQDMRSLCDSVQDAAARLSHALGWRPEAETIAA